MTSRLFCAVSLIDGLLENYIFFIMLQFDFFDLGCRNASSEYSGMALIHSCGVSGVSSEVLARITVVVFRSVVHAAMSQARISSHWFLEVLGSKLGFLVFCDKLSGISYQPTLLPGNWQVKEIGS